MKLFRRRKREIEEAAARLEQAVQRATDVHARVKRLEAEIEIYGPLTRARGHE